MRPEQKGGTMPYRVHRIDVSRHNMQEKLEQFINHLNGEVVAVLPNVRPTFQFMGATARVDFLLVVEKTG
jgi:hypothetical protein